MWPVDKKEKKMKKKKIQKENLSVRLVIVFKVLLMFLFYLTRNE